MAGENFPQNPQRRRRRHWQCGHEGRISKQRWILGLRSKSTGSVCADMSRTDEASMQRLVELETLRIGRRRPAGRRARESHGRHPQETRDRGGCRARVPCVWNWKTSADQGTRDRSARVGARADTSHSRQSARTSMCSAPAKPFNAKIAASPIKIGVRQIDRST